MSAATASKAPAAETTTDASGEAPVETPNKVKVEDAGPARKRITITVPAEVIDEKLQESMATLSTETSLPGFRKGRAPKQLMERRFGTAVRGETKNQLVASAYASAIEEHNIKPVSEPEPVDDMSALELEPGKPFSFAVEVEVAPEFDLPSLDGIEVKKPMLEISDERIEQEVKRQRVTHGTPAEIEGDFIEDDRLLGYAAVTRNDEAEPFFRQDDVVIVYPGESGRGQVLGLMIDDLGKKLKGAKIGDTMTFETTGPEAHERADIRGAKLSMSFELRKAYRITPATAEEVAERFMLPGPDILREQIKLALEQRRDEEQASAMREQAIDQLAEKVDFPLPEKMSAQQAARAVEQYRLDLLYQGMSTDEVEEKLAEVRGESEAAVRARLKRFFLLHKLGEHFNIEVSEQEINGRIAAIAAQRGVRPEALRNELTQSGRLGEVARLIRDQKAGDRLIQQAKVSEITADEWNKRFAERKSGAKSAATAKQLGSQGSESGSAGSKGGGGKKKTSKKSSS